ncbi:MAG TPA: TIGR00730 family Rossman fold protein [Allosphingosinicella sp.]|nr:TIGR00730 family Rossman fold protein [Allosphingosinicella sp.]
MEARAALCVFCGSSIGRDVRYREAAVAAGQALVRGGIDLVYGGGRIGLMGIIADAVLAGGGRVTGVIPQDLLDRELGHSGLTALHVVGSMHERKAKMAELSDGFIALPGGAGTLEEMFEQWTWAQLGIHAKPCGFLNADGYFDPVRAMIARMVAEGFLSPEHADILVFASDIGTLLDCFEDRFAPARRWRPQTAVPRP